MCPDAPRAQKRLSTAFFILPAGTALSLPLPAAANFPLAYSVMADFCRASFFEFPSYLRTAWKRESTIIRFLMLIDGRSCFEALHVVIREAV